MLMFAVKVERQILSHMQVDPCYAKNETLSAIGGEGLLLYGMEER